MDNDTLYNHAIVTLRNFAKLAIKYLKLKATKKDAVVDIKSR